MIMRTDAYPHGPHRLMVLETPLLRVSRPVAACSRCRAAKVKCDGKLPACTACEKSNRASECSSTNDQFARGKERSYVATLEAKVERLEKKLAEQRARRKSSTLMLDMSETSTPRRTSVDTVKAKPISQRAARRKEAVEIDDLVSGFGLLYASQITSHVMLLIFTGRSMPPHETFMASQPRCHMLGSSSRQAPRNHYPKD